MRSEKHIYIYAAFLGHLNPYEMGVLDDRHKAPASLLDPCFMHLMKEVTLPSSQLTLLLVHWIMKGVLWGQVSFRGRRRCVLDTNSYLGSVISLFFPPNKVP